MTATVLLLVAALCVAPWRPRAADRLDGLHPAADGSAPRNRRPGRAGAVLRVPRVAETLARATRPGPVPADTGALAQLLDLLAVALLAGLPAPDALAAVADAVDHTDPDSARPLRAAAARMRLGATPAEAWREVPGAARLAPIASVLTRATDGGGSVRAALEHAADRMRSEADAAATARAERAAVMVAGPLGLCFLPAFVCLGVLPVVVGLADGMLPGVLP